MGEMPSITKAPIKEFFESFLELVSENSSWEIRGLVDPMEVTGTRQESDHDYFDHLWVDQEAGGGITGDDFYGFMYIPIPNEGHYIKIWYNC